MNKEATMFALCGVRSFELRHSFVIRHSDFVIPPVRHSSFVISAHGP